MVIAVFSILAGIGGYSYLRGLPERRVRAACRDLYTGIHKARALAVRQCADAAIVFDPDAGIYTIQDADGKAIGAPHVFPDHIRIHDVTGSDGKGQGVEAYTFNSRGMKYPPSGKVKIRYYKSGCGKMGVRVTSAGSIAVISDTDANW